jgi:hypothetical protein
MASGQQHLTMNSATALMTPRNTEGGMDPLPAQLHQPFVKPADLELCHAPLNGLKAAWILNETGIHPWARKFPLQHVARCLRFRQQFTLEDAIGSHAWSLDASKRWHSSLLSTPRTVSHCTFRPNTEGQHLPPDPTHGSAAWQLY